MRVLIHRLLLASVGVASFAAPAIACPVCFGDTDSPLAAGVNWGIFLLLGVTGGVLAAFASFFVYLFKRSRATRGEEFEAQRSVHEEGSY